MIDDSNDGRPCLKIEVQYLKVKVSKLNETPTPQIHVIEMSRQALLSKFSIRFEFKLSV